VRTIKAFKNHPVAPTAADRARKVVTDGAANVTEHDIARRAYDLYLGRGCEDGHDVEDWFQAERELRRSSVV
jgi:Protein of unknown function (DUF2934)